MQLVALEPINLPSTLFLQEENKPTSARTQILVNMFLLLLLEFIFSKLNSKFNSLTLNHLTVAPSHLC